MAEWTGLGNGLNVGNEGKGRDFQFCELSNGILPIGNKGVCIMRIPMGAHSRRTAEVKHIK